MSRISLWHVLGAFAVAIVGVAFLLGYLNARAEVPETTAGFAAPVVSTVTGFVDEIDGDRVVVATDNDTFFTLDLTEVSVVAVSLPGGWDDIEAGDTIVIAIETDQFGGRALRAAVVTPGERSP